MKRFVSIILLLGAMIMTQNLSAQMKTSYFMEGSYFRTDLNPALAPTRGYIALPLLSGISGGFYSNYNSYENMNFKRENGYVNALSPSVSAEEFLSKLPDECIQGVDLNFGLFKLGFYTPRGTHFNFGINGRVNFNAAAPKDFYRVMKGDLDGNINVGNMSNELTQYIETYAGTAIRLGDNLTVGARFKFLIGLQNIMVDIDRLSAAEDAYYVHGNIKYNGVGSEVLFLDDNVNEWEINDNLATGFGGAIDLGAELRLFDNRLKFSAAVTDLGVIKWSEDAQLSATINSEMSRNLDLFDLLNLNFIEEENNNVGYVTHLTSNVSFGAEYNFLNNHFAIGALSHTRIQPNGMMTEFTASFNMRPTNWMTLTASHSFLNGNTPGIFGAAVNFHPGLINIFLGMDYISNTKNTTDFEPTTMSEIDTLLSPKATSYNLYVGVGFNFGRPDFLK